jgi:hypothetical protein
VSPDKRQAKTPTVEFVGDKTSGAAGLALGRILNQLLTKLFPLVDWNPARETFTKQTTSLMWQNNPDPARWVGVACYNKGWDVDDRSAISDVVNVNLKLGALHTNYDCMYIGHNNAFHTQSDGGYQNVSMLPWSLRRVTTNCFYSLPTHTTKLSAATNQIQATLYANRLADGVRQGCVGASICYLDGKILPFGLVYNCPTLLSVSAWYIRSLTKTTFLS